MFYVAYRTLLVMFCVLKFYFVDFYGMFTSSPTYTKKICATICLHDSSEIIARTQNFFSCGLASTIFQCIYSFHVYLIELMFDVDYRW